MALQEDAAAETRIAHHAVLRARAAFLLAGRGIAGGGVRRGAVAERQIAAGLVPVEGARASVVAGFALATRAARARRRARAVRTLHAGHGRDGAVLVRLALAVRRARDDTPHAVVDAAPAPGGRDAARDSQPGRRCRTERHETFIRRRAFLRDVEDPARAVLADDVGADPRSVRARAARLERRAIAHGRARQPHGGGPGDTRGSTESVGGAALGDTAAALSADLAAPAGAPGRARAGCGGRSSVRFHLPPPLTEGRRAAAGTYCHQNCAQSQNLSHDAFSVADPRCVRPP